MVATNGNALRFKAEFIAAHNEITTVLGPLESQIMAVVWQMNHATAADVHHDLQASRQRENRNIAYTTVMTTMSRLYDKGILHRRKVGISFVYTPVLARDAFANLVVKSVLESLVAEFGQPVFHYFVDYIAHNAELRQELYAALAAPVAAGESNN